MKCTTEGEEKTYDIIMVVRNDVELTLPGYIIVAKDVTVTEIRRRSEHPFIRHHKSPAKDVISGHPYHLGEQEC